MSTQQKSNCFIILVLVLGFSLISCSKKQQALEEMQQPISIEDVNRLKTEAEPLARATTQAGERIVVFNPEGKLETLPPSGPFKPTDKQIQIALKNTGYYHGAIDGKIGPLSKKAIEEFQRANGLVVDGKVGPKTWAVLVKFLQSLESTSDEVQ